MDIFVFLCDCYKVRAGRKFDENKPENDKNTEAGELFNILLNLKKDRIRNSSPIFKITFSNNNTN